MKEHTLWIEKYRSQQLEGYVGNQEIKKIISNCIKNNDLPHFLLYGTPGTGKTTLAKLLVSNLDCDYLYINASDERGIDTIREKVQGFASSATFKPLKVIILDEADYITNLGQAALRNIIEEYSISVRFILTCNYQERIIEPLQSRCQQLKIIPPSKSEVAEHISQILDRESIKYQNEDLVLLINKFYPDIRSILKNAQTFSFSGSLIIDKNLLHSSSNYLDLLLEELKNIKTDSWKKIRQLIADNEITDFEESYKFIFEKIEEITKDKEKQALAIITVEEYLYHAQFRIDKEINFSSFICKLTQILK